LLEISACWEAIKPPLDRFEFIYPRVAKHYGLAQMDSVFIQPYNPDRSTIHPMFQMKPLQQDLTKDLPW
jgi:hypothetical protein